MRFMVQSFPFDTISLLLFNTVMVFLSPYKTAVELPINVIFAPHPISTKRVFAPGQFIVEKSPKSNIVFDAPFDTIVFNTPFETIFFYYDLK